MKEQSQKHESVSPSHASSSQSLIHQVSNTRMEQAYPEEKSPIDRTLGDEDGNDQSREAFMFLPRLNEVSGT